VIVRDRHGTKLDGHLSKTEYTPKIRTRRYHAGDMNGSWWPPVHTRLIAASRPYIAGC